MSPLLAQEWPELGTISYRRPNLRLEDTRQNLQPVSSALSADDLAVICPYLQRVASRQRCNATAGQPQDRGDLLSRKLALPAASLVKSGRFASGALIGSEGMTGLPILLGTDRGPNDVVVHAEGYAQFISADDLRTVILSNPSIHWCFLRYAHAFTVQSLYTAFANAQGKLEERVARWLLMAHDRLQSDVIPVTHKMFSLLLGVRRAGITVALQSLGEARLD